VQDLDITKTIVFSYNLYLSKLGTMYKKTIKRIQIRLEEYLLDKKAFKQVARVARKLDPNLPEVSLSSNTKDES
jgi:hypothetical protein